MSIVPLQILWATLATAAPSPAASPEIQNAGDWEGTWVTDRGALTLEVSGSRVRGEFGDGGSLEGRLRGDELEAEWELGRSSGEATFEMQEAGRHFTGRWTAARGGGTWRGWRSDPEATDADDADFSGTWLSSLGILQLEQDGDEVTGVYGADGWATVEGTVQGRRLGLEIERIRWKGSAWLEMTPDGTRFFGLTDERPATKWFGVRPEGFERDPEPEAGEIVRGIAENGMLYFLRMADDWRRGRGTDAIILLHGSNWTTAGMTAVTARNWPELAEGYAIVGIQGERWADWSDPDDLRFNYSYTDWMGRSTYDGYPYTDRASPTLVHEVVAELREEHDFERIFVVGHSQGGFLAYLLLMHFPESFAGVAPMAGGIVIQAEPDVFDDEDLMEAQRATPVALVHGTRDAQWGPRQGGYNFERLVSHGFALARYLTPDAGHPYDFLPVGEAMRHLDALSTDDVDVLREYAEERADEEDWRGVAAALIHAERIGKASALRALRKRLDRAAEKRADDYLDLIEDGDGGDWVANFLEWRTQFAHAPAAAEVMDALHDLREKHDGRAEPLIEEARALRRKGDEDGARERYEEVLEKWFAATRAGVVRLWLERMD